MRKTFVLCDYCEGENGEITLKKLEQVEGDEDSAKRRAFELWRGDNSKQIVLLTKLEVETSNW